MKGVGKGGRAGAPGTFCEITLGICLIYKGVCALGFTEVARLFLWPIPFTRDRLGFHRRFANRRYGNLTGRDVTYFYRNYSLCDSDRKVVA